MCKSSRNCQTRGETVNLSFTTTCHVIVEPSVISHATFRTVSLTFLTEQVTSLVELRV